MTPFIRHTHTAPRTVTCRRCGRTLDIIAATQADARHVAHQAGWRHTDPTDMHCDDCATS